MIPILENNSEFIIANKPSGLSFHQEQQVDGLHTSLSNQLNCKLWPVHRLDKLTSGLVIFAKTKEAAAQFGHLFESRLIDKQYIALSDKKPKKKMGKVIGDMAKSRSGSWKLLRSRDNSAYTEFKSYPASPGIRLFVVKPTTGKTHQIRVALKAIGAPILGDIRYGGSAADRGYLHSHQLSFEWHGTVKQFQLLPNQGVHFAEHLITPILTQPNDKA